MNRKVGRNYPCPCGSGKKYKKCCGPLENHEPTIPPSLLTGTSYDEYFQVIPLVATYGERISRFEKDGKELGKAVLRFEKKFRPGKKGGITDSFFMSWLHFDLRFGESGETIAERFLKDPLTSGLIESGRSLVRELALSYFSFYEVIKPASREVSVQELVTGRRFAVTDIPEIYEIDPAPGEILFSRLVGPPRSAILFTTPYVFGPEARAEFERILRLQEEDFRLMPAASRFPPERAFAESQKEFALFWAEYALVGERIGAQAPTLSPDEPPEGLYPRLFNTDGEELMLAEIHFRIKDEPALRKKLASLGSYEYDEKESVWLWMKPLNRKDPEAPRTILGRFMIKENRLIAEVNSRERAALLRAQFKERLGGLVAYDKTLWRDPDDLPELSPEEAEADRKERERLNARPEVREAVRGYLERHYFKDWPRMKIPALGGLTPLQAAKTKAGRAKLEALLEDFEEMGQGRASTVPRIDIGRLRRILGLPPKAG